MPEQQDQSQEKKPSAPERDYRKPQRAVRSLQPVTPPDESET
jgi:hypothetical protein